MEKNIIICDLCNKVINPNEYRNETLRGERIDLCDECVSLIRSRQQRNNTVVHQSDISFRLSVEEGIKIVNEHQDPVPVSEEPVTVTAFISNADATPSRLDPYDITPVEVEEGAELPEETPQAADNSDEESGENWDEIAAKKKAERKTNKHLRNEKLPLPESKNGQNLLSLEKLRMLVNLYNFNWSMQAIADEIGISKNNVASLIYRVRQGKIK